LRVAPHVPICHRLSHCVKIQKCAPHSRGVRRYPLDNCAPPPGENLVKCVPSRFPLLLSTLSGATFALSVSRSHIICRAFSLPTFDVKYTGWLKIKYPTGQYAISSQPVVRFSKFLKLLNPDNCPNPTVYNVSTAP